ncbi:MAG: hypothetical protein JST04_18265 [Bdellovibrionales bacterium]|nr:hypothetical protein [Bdellovibrionales bacterium]
MRKWVNQLSLSKASRGWALVGTLATAISAVSGARAEDARTLPKGRSRLSFTYAKSNGISQQYNDSGVAEDFTKPYNMNLNSEKISTFAATISPEFGNLVSLLNDTGLRYDASKANTASGGITATDPNQPLLGDALTKGFLGVDAEATQSQSVIQYMTGITDRLSVGFMIPIVTTTVRASAQISKINNTVEDYQKAFAAMGAGFEPIVNGLQQLDAANIETLQQYALENNGYKRFGSSETTGLGDVNFGSRYNYLKTPKERWLNSVQLSVSAPTGKTHPANAITEVDNGAGTWTTTAAHIINWAPFGQRSPWSFSHGDHFMYQLPGKKIMRVRNSSTDILPDASTEEDVNTHYGSKFWTNLGTKYTVNPMWSFETSYEWYWKGRDNYSGSRDKDYSYLGDATDTYLETLTLQGNFSLIDAFSNHRFPLPVDASLSYNKTIAGRNKPVTTVWIFELAMYF